MEIEFLYKDEIIERISAHANITKKDARKWYNAVMEVIEDAIIEGDKEFKLGNFGTYKLRYSDARSYIHPKTKEMYVKPEHYRPSFKFNEELTKFVRDETAKTLSGV